MVSGMTRTGRFGKVIAAIGSLLRMFRIDSGFRPPAMPEPRPAAAEFEPLPMQMIARTADRDMLLAAGETHPIQPAAAGPDPSQSAAGFPLHLYQELFQSGPGRHATWAHVCKTAGRTPLLIHSTPGNRCAPPSSSRHATSHRRP
jgi:hypothetical protein